MKIEIQLISLKQVSSVIEQEATLEEDQLILYLYSSKWAQIITQTKIYPLCHVFTRCRHHRECVFVSFTPHLLTTAVLFCSHSQRPMFSHWICFLEWKLGQVGREIDVCTLQESKNSGRTGRAQQGDNTELEPWRIGTMAYVSSSFRL